MNPKRVKILVLDEGNVTLSSFILDFKVPQQLEFFVEDSLKYASDLQATIQVEVNNLNLTLNGVKLQRSNDKH